jgi:hypothetical protein
VINLIGVIFPFVQERTEESWHIATYMAPHADRLIELAESATLSSKLLAVLTLRMSQFSNLLRLFNVAMDLAEKARAMAVQEWESDLEWKLIFSEHLNKQFLCAARTHEDEKLVRELLLSLDSPAVMASMDLAAIRARRVRLQNALASCLLKREQHAERETIHRQSLASGFLDENSAEGINIQHNLAHALCHEKKFEEAITINETLLAFAITKKGKRVVTLRLYTIMLNLCCLILGLLAQCVLGVLIVSRAGKNRSRIDYSPCIGSYSKPRETISGSKI